MKLTDHDKEILQAVIDGKKIEYSTWSGEWIGPRYDKVLELIRDGQGHRTRIKPETIMIGDMEVPKPINERPKDGFTAFYIVDIISPELGSKEFWVASPRQQMALRRGLMQATHDGMIQHAKALIKISGDSYE